MKLLPLFVLAPTLAYATLADPPPGEIPLIATGYTLSIPDKQQTPPSHVLNTTANFVEVKSGEYPKIFFTFKQLSTTQLWFETVYTNDDDYYIYDFGGFHGTPTKTNYTGQLGTCTITSTHIKCHAFQGNMAQFDIAIDFVIENRR